MRGNTAVMSLPKGRKVFSINGFIYMFLVSLSCIIIIIIVTSIYINQFVCLFVCSRFGQKLLHRAPQTLRDYEIQFGKCPPWVKIDRLTVHAKNLRFPVFSFTADGHF